MNDKNVCFGQLHLFLLFAMFLLSDVVIGQNCGSHNNVGGIVFADYNFNGEYDEKGAGLEGIKVEAYNSLGHLLGSAITNSAGKYTIGVPDGMKVRLEFSDFPAGYYEGYYGSDSKTSVQFVTSPGCDVNLGLSTLSGDMCNSTPSILTSQYVNGKRTGDAGNRSTLVLARHNQRGYAADYSTDPPTPGGAGLPKTISRVRETGATWGIAWDARSKTAFASTVVKRFSDFGPGGIGMIYKIVNPDGSFTGSPYIDLASCIGGMSAMARPGMPNSAGSPGYDVEAYNAAGKEGIGDIDVSDDGMYLYAVSLSTKELVQVKLRNSPSDPLFSSVSCSNITTYPIPQIPSCNGSDNRPWATKCRGGKVYVGEVCSAESTDAPSDMTMQIFEFDPNTGAWNGLFDSPQTLNYSTKGCAAGSSSGSDPYHCCEWLPWLAPNEYLFDGPDGSGFICHPQPLLSDIEFDRDGSIIIGFMDRFGLQIGWKNYHRPNKELFYAILGGGDLLYAYNDKDADKYVVAYGQNILDASGNVVKVGCGDGTGADEGEEFYCADNSAGNHNEGFHGGLAIDKQRDELLGTFTDVGGNLGGKRTASGGFTYIDNGSGSPIDYYTLYYNGNEFTYGKSMGVGDLERLCDPPPIEIGNKVWLDYNQNGIQDPGESFLEGIVINLYDQGGTLLATETTDQDGEYKFSSVDYPTKLIEGGTYVVSVDNYVPGVGLAGTTRVSTTLDSGTNDKIDSDGKIDGASGIAAIGQKPYTVVHLGNLGQNNHSYDFGFYSTDCSLEVDYEILDCNSTKDPLTVDVRITIEYFSMAIGDEIEVNLGGNIKTFTVSETKGTKVMIFDVPVNQPSVNLTVTNATTGLCSDNSTISTVSDDITAEVSLGNCYFDHIRFESKVPVVVTYSWQNLNIGDQLRITMPDGKDHFVDIQQESGNGNISAVVLADGSSGHIKLGGVNISPCSWIEVPYTLPGECLECLAYVGSIKLGECVYDGTTSTSELSVEVHWFNQTLGQTITVSVPTAVGTTTQVITAATESDNKTVKFMVPSNGSTDNAIDIDFGGCHTKDTVYTALQSCEERRDLALDKTADVNAANVGDIVTWTISVTHQGDNFEATGVVVEDLIPNGLTYNGTSNATKGSFNGTKWTVGTMNLGDIETLTFETTVDKPGVYINKAEISVMNEGDSDSTPGNGNESEDDYDQDCVSVPYDFCEGDKHKIGAQPGLHNYQWYKDGIEIAGATSRVYTVTSPGEYTFEATKTADPTKGEIYNCCPIKFESAVCNCTVSLVTDLIGCVEDKNQSTTNLEVCFDWDKQSANEVFTVNVSGNKTAQLTQTYTVGSASGRACLNFDVEIDDEISVEVIGATCQDGKTGIETPKYCDPVCDITLNKPTVGTCDFDAATGNSTASVNVGFSWNSLNPGIDTLVFVSAGGFLKYPVTTEDGTDNVQLQSIANGMQNTIYMRVNSNSDCVQSEDFLAPEACDDIDCNIRIYDVLYGFCQDNEVDVTFFVNWANAKEGDIVTMVVGGQTKTLPPLSAELARLGVSSFVFKLPSPTNGNAQVSISSGCSDTESYSYDTPCLPCELNISSFDVIEPCYYNEEKQRSESKVRVCVEWANALLGDNVIIQLGDNLAEGDGVQERFGINNESSGSRCVDLIVIADGTQDMDLNVGFAVGNCRDSRPDYFDVSASCAIDLALKKRAENIYVKYGEDVPFTITVFNQGYETPKEVSITDYIPEGFDFDATKNTGWSVASPGKLEYVLKDVELNPGDSSNITLVLTPRLGAQPGHKFINEAEISEIRDTADNVRIDLDSWPDDDPDNDNDVVPGSEDDDEIEGTAKQDSDEDEDDNDVAEVKLMDLALKKELPEDAKFRYGDFITFNLTVYNQGDVAVKDVEITDYVPEGFTFDAIRNPLWNGADTDKPVYTIGNTIMPGDSVKFNITLLCNYIGEPNPEAWVNVAEISKIHNVEGEDVSQFDYDSTPDDNPDNDAGGKPDSPSDDSVDGTGTGVPGSEDPNTDEDDADPVRVKVYDLALRKKLVAPEFYTYYDLLTFEITVFNQGTDPVRDVMVYDSVPHGLQYNSSDNPDWTGSVPIVRTTIPGVIEAGDSAKAQIKLVMLPYDGDLHQWDNYAEIVSSKDTSGQITITWDADSNPNSNSPHEVAVRPHNPDDNNIDGHYMPDGTDEDDHDPAGVGIYDLALKKNLSASPTSLEYGQVVDFDITVYNQGSFAAKNIKVVDYIPEGYHFAEHLNIGWDYSPYTSVASTIIKDTLPPQDSITVTLTLQFRYTPEKGGYLNVAEIAYSEDDGGNPRDDFDSVADENPDNDGGGKVNTPSDDSVDGDGTGKPGDENPNTDEDDADPWGIEVASIGNYVWFDKNDNGLQDDGLPSEVGVEGVTVILYTEGGVKLLTQKTDSLGHYLFENLIPGKYSLKFEDLPPNSIWAKDNEGNDDGLDSDPDSTGWTIQTELTPGENDLSWDAGIVVLSSIGDYVWMDDNEDGIQDEGERPVWDMVVNLLDKDGKVLKTTKTDVSGKYLFTGLHRGTYIVEFVKDENISFTVPNTPGDEGKDSDADINTGRSGTIELGPDQHIRTVDAGLICTIDVEVLNPGVSCESGPILLESNLSGGAKPVRYYWSTGENTPNIEVPADVAKTYSLTVTDDFGCRDIEDVTISVPPKSKIGDYVWYDKNRDGLQQDNQFDPSHNEFGIDSVTVKLYEVVGGVAKFLRDTFTTTVLGKKGYYSFDVCAGDYLLEFVPPTGKGYSFTNQNIGDDDSDDSDADPNTGRTHIFTVSSGKDDFTLDAGLFRTASLGDYVWHDSNVDGIQNDDEKGVDSVKVILKRADGTKLDSMYTHDGGKYEFTDLVPDWYFVCFDYSETEYSKISPKDAGNDDEKDSDAGENGCTETTQIIAGENDLSWDMGLYSLSSLGDRVWLDKDANGCQDSGEKGIEGVKVNLYYDRDMNGVPDPGAVILATEKTDSLGYYKFEGLEADKYVVQFVKPTTPKYYSSPKNSNDSSTGGCGDKKDSDGDPIMGYSHGVSLGDDEHNPTIDQGYYEKASVGDKVWLDDDLDGIQDDGETGVSKVTVTLYKDTDGDGVPEKAIETMVTDENGNYLFDELDPGTYHICFDLSGSSYSVFTTAHSSGSSSKNDSNADEDSGCTEVFVLNSGDEDFTQDAGVIETCSLGDYVWFDDNADGIQNIVERGIQGVIVTLYNEAGEVKKDTTDLQGKYLFSKLRPGKYKVHFSNPDSSSYVASPRYAYNKGDDSNADIDGFSEEVTLVGGQHDPTIDAGFYKGACLEGEYWLEEIDNKVHDLQDNSDKEVEGVKIRLYSDEDESEPGDDVLFDTTTVRGGAFYFSNVPAGNYYYTAELPDETELVKTKSELGSDTIDSDFYKTESGIYRSHRFNVEPGRDSKSCKKYIDIGVTKQETLPVEVLEFNADWNEGQDVVGLIWSTMNEANLSYFELYRRAENEENFVKLADVEAVGGLSVESYGMIDPNIEFGLRYYYRLVPIDFDGQGKSKYEASVLIPGNEFKVNAYPNPVTDNLYIVISGEITGGFTVELLDNLGRKVINKVKVKGSSATYEKVRLDMRDLPQGTYYIRVVKGTKLELYKIVHTI